jgi:hypothetical protein
MCIYRSRKERSADRKYTGGAGQDRTGKRFQTAVATYGTQARCKRIDEVCFLRSW